VTKKNEKSAEEFSLQNGRNFQLRLSRKSKNGWKKLNAAEFSVLRTAVHYFSFSCACANDHAEEKYAEQNGCLALVHTNNFA
jgi:hypothetical protein